MEFDIHKIGNTRALGDIQFQADLQAYLTALEAHHKDIKDGNALNIIRAFRDVVALSAANLNLNP